MSRSVPNRASLRLETACALSNRFDSVETGCVGGPSHVHAWGLHNSLPHWHPLPALVLLDELRVPPPVAASSFAAQPGSSTALLPLWQRQIGWSCRPTNSFWSRAKLVGHLDQPTKSGSVRGYLVTQTNQRAPQPGDALPLVVFSISFSLPMRSHTAAAVSSSIASAVIATGPLANSATVPPHPR